MISDKYTYPFFQVITSNTHIVDIKSAAAFWNVLNEARITFENSVSDSLILLSDEQQVRLLLQVLSGLKSREMYYIDEWHFKSTSLQEKYYRMQEMHNRCMEYMLGVRGSQNSSLSEEEISLLSGTIISEEFAEANENIRQEYLSRMGEEKALPWILDKAEYIARNSEWRAEERERLGLPPDERTYIEKLSDAFFENSDDLDPIGAENPTPSPIPWRYGLADFAETLYKLERKGAIDLKAYFDNRGTAAGLVRSICQLFTFPNDNPSATLNNYLSEIRKNLGRGPLDAGVLKAIGRIRGGKMDDVLPDETS